MVVLGAAPATISIQEAKTLGNRWITSRSSPARFVWNEDNLADEPGAGHPRDDRSTAAAGGAEGLRAPWVPAEAWFRVVLDMRG